MIIALLGLLDLWTGLYLFMIQFDLSAASVAFGHSLYLFIKAIIFWGDLYSLLDIIVSVYILLALLGISHILVTIIASLYLVQKAYFSLRYSSFS